MQKKWRKSEQILLPKETPSHREDTYHIYPAFKLDEDQIFIGYESLAELISKNRTVIIDGYTGVFYDQFQEKLEDYFKECGLRASWEKTSDYFKPKASIDKLIAPFLGGDDPQFGKRTTLSLEDLYDLSLLKNIEQDPGADINLIIGPGAILTGWKGLIIYIDIPKNEIQFRSRAGSVKNLGASNPDNHRDMYKRFYFVDWIILNKHKRSILEAVDIFVDAQAPENPSWIKGELLRHSLNVMSRNVFRVRPWFEPGVWGGTWIRDHIEGLNKDVINYAWSFELIAPENGLLFESSARLLEVSFDSLMFLEAEAVLGSCYKRFGTNFPIRFDFLDTFNGGNLSIQCHPLPDYMKRNFGEDFTQEETYYIIDTKDKAVVYLGFQDDIDSVKFRSELEKSFEDSESINIDHFVQKHFASKHDLFLIPPGTIHGSGKNNLVLEISSTPYIFTFKLYDWLRPDLDGKPRPLSIKRGMDNLRFDRKGRYVKEKLISKPVLMDHGKDWQLYHLPTHESHLYDVHRLHFITEIEVRTENKCHVLSLVDGKSVLVITENGFSQQFSYAETFVIPAASGSYRIINKSVSPAIVIKAFVK